MIDLQVLSASSEDKSGLPRTKEEEETEPRNETSSSHCLYRVIYARRKIISRTRASREESDPRCMRQDGRAGKIAVFAFPRRFLSCLPSSSTRTPSLPSQPPRSLFTHSPNTTSYRVVTRRLSTTFSNQLHVSPGQHADLLPRPPHPSSRSQ